MFYNWPCLLFLKIQAFSGQNLLLMLIVGCVGEEGTQIKCFYVTAVTRVIICTALNLN